jgi:hypothetical protein
VQIMRFDLPVHNRTPWWTKSKLLAATVLCRGTKFEDPSHWEGNPLFQIEPPTRDEVRAQPFIVYWFPTNSLTTQDRFRGAFQPFLIALGTNQDAAEDVAMTWCCCGWNLQILPHHDKSGLGLKRRTRRKIAGWRSFTLSMNQFTIILLKKFPVI